MKQLSFWAKNHPKQARWLIALAHVLLFPLAFLLGFQLWLNEFEYSAIAHDVFTTLFLLAVLVYPLKSATNRVWKHSYRRQKVFDFSIVLSGFLALASLTDMKLETSSAINFDGFALKTALKPPDHAKSGSFKWRDNMSWHALKKNARMLKKELHAARKMAKSNDGETALNILFTFLILLLAIGLASLIAAWACDLSCSGQEGAASIVLIGGGALLILLTILGIRGIWRKRKKVTTQKLE